MLYSFPIPVNSSIYIVLCFLLYITSLLTFYPLDQLCVFSNNDTEDIVIGFRDNPSVARLVPRWLSGLMFPFQIIKFLCTSSLMRVVAPSDDTLCARQFWFCPFWTDLNLCWTYLFFYSLECFTASASSPCGEKFRISESSFSPYFFLSVHIGISYVPKTSRRFSNPSCFLVHEYADSFTVG